jgi:hypothetical protein
MGDVGTNVITSNDNYYSEDTLEEGKDKSQEDNSVYPYQVSETTKLEQTNKPDNDQSTHDAPIPVEIA